MKMCTNYGRPNPDPTLRALSPGDDLGDSDELDELPQHAAPLGRAARAVVLAPLALENEDDEENELAEDPEPRKRPRLSKKPSRGCTGLRGVSRRLDTKTRRKSYQARKKPAWGPLGAGAVVICLHILCEALDSIHPSPNRLFPIRHPETVPFNSFKSLTEELLHGHCNTVYGFILVAGVSLGAMVKSKSMSPF